MISAEQRAEIRRLYYAEHWKVGTIAAALGVHRDTVALAIEAERFLARHDARPRPSRLDPFLPFVRETLTRWPRLRATRLYEMLRGRGYAGAGGQLRRGGGGGGVGGRVGGAAPAEAYLRLRVLPAEQAQADWGCFGTVGEGRAKR